MICTPKSATIFSRPNGLKNCISFGVHYTPMFALCKFKWTLRENQSPAGLCFFRSIGSECLVTDMHLPEGAEDAIANGSWTEFFWERRDNRTDCLPMMTSIAWPIGGWKNNVQNSQMHYDCYLQELAALTPFVFSSMEWKVAWVGMCRKSSKYFKDHQNAFMTTRTF